MAYAFFVDGSVTMKHAFLKALVPYGNSSLKDPTFILESRFLFINSFERRGFKWWRTHSLMMVLVI